MKAEGSKILTVINNIIAVSVFAAILVAGILTGQMFIKLLPTLISVVVYFFTARVSRYAYLIGGFNALLYCVGFYMEGVYGSLISALVFSAPVQIYTFFAWRKHSYKQAAKFRRLKFKYEILIVIGTAICWAAAYIIMLNVSSARQQFFDMGVLVVGTVASLLVAGACIEAVAFNVFNVMVNIGLWIASIVSGNVSGVTYLIINIFSFYCVIVSSVKWLMLYKELKKIEGEGKQDADAECNAKQTEERLPNSLKKKILKGE